ncbi:hypothetical protein JKP75_14850 [Blastococcus sp. TML/M2B]|uniref:hypothetical protein n=1 Tax=unclassified Blastococcus TaxID=2619396 RepID=UPI00190BB385|nr:MULTISPECIES: hypothetical protein [unclassified Blastococcus]MBN1093718.1 hypothetical protein [Blastococcus sp. TML/M2B]MBN1096160.1 hypothetical protein [Blastococcus sp. TML/C7B]
MTVRDRVRIERAVQSYDWWLDLRGAPRRRRRELRTELRSNLRDATAHVGSRAAVSGLGSTRQMAAEVVPEDPTRPRWTAGLQAGGAALAIAVLVALLAGLAWADGAMSADANSPARGSVALLPGSSMEYEPLGDGFSVSTGVGWLPLAVGVLVFVAVARPWRALRAQTSTVPPLRQ